VHTPGLHLAWSLHYNKNCEGFGIFSKSIFQSLIAGNQNMKKHMFIFILASICLICFPSILRAEKDESPILSQILEKCAEYCKRLDQVFLDFVCHEEIKEYIYFLGNATKYIDNTFVYDYQLIRNGISVKEQRILIEVNGLRKHEKNAELKTKRLKYEYIIFGPIGLLGKDQQLHHDYKIQKEKKFEGENCYVIEIVPKSSERTDSLFGKAWVRQSDCSIVKIEWEQRSMSGFERVEKETKIMGARPQITFVSEYAFEKNGIRFPSRNIVREYIHFRWGKEKKSEITVVYKNYKFFIVDTEVKIK
jgi:hypothetical protein